MSWLRWPRLQVESDHLISCLLGYLSAQFVDRIMFIAGTASARTHFVDGRLSEDIGLIAVDPRSGVARDLNRALLRGIPQSARCPGISLPCCVSGPLSQSRCSCCPTEDGRRDLWKVGRSNSIALIPPSAHFSVSTRAAVVTGNGMV